MPMVVAQLKADLKSDLQAILMTSSHYAPSDCYRSKRPGCAS